MDAVPHPILLHDQMTTRMHERGHPQTYSDRFPRHRSYPKHPDRIALVPPPDALVEFFEFFPASRTPVFAAVNGDALEGGFGLVGSCGIVIAVKSAKLGTIEASLGAWHLVRCRTASGTSQGSTRQLRVVGPPVKYVQTILHQSQCWARCQRSWRCVPMAPVAGMPKELVVPWGIACAANE